MARPLQGDPDFVIELWTRQGPCQIELMSGDITTLPQEDAVDIIMVSAFPGDYTALTGTVIGALRNRLGISVLDLSYNKELDLRALFSCWLSKPITTYGSPFKKLLCFERRRGIEMTVAAQIREMFRVFVPVFNNQDHTVITPLLATGHQGYSRQVVCGAMIEAAIQWIYAGLPLRKFKIVVYEGIDDSIKKVFIGLKQKHMKKSNRMKNRIFNKPFDVYITFNQKDQEYMHKVKQMLETGQKDIKIYIEMKKFDENKVWQDEIFNIMVSCKRIIVILSPAFLENAECLEKYNMAMCCNRLLGVNVLIPFYVDTISSLPTYMGLVQWIDCRVRKDGETVDGKLNMACSHVLLSLKEQEMTEGEQTDKITETKTDKGKYQFDVFISYSHKNPEKAEKVLEIFQQVDPNVKVFYDRSALTTGSNWQNMLYESVGECQCFIALISAAYVASTVCQEEYSLALARYLTKDKDMMLVPLLTENLENIPPSMSGVEMMKVWEDFDKAASELAVSVVDWLRLTVDKRPPVVTVKEPVDIEAILSASRCEEARRQYQVVKKSTGGNEFRRIHPVPIPDEKLEEIDKSQVDIAVSYANDATHLAGSFCALVDRIYPNLNISVHSIIDQKRLSDLDKAKKIVIFISNDFLQNEHQMQELHLAICRQRSQKSTVLYLIKATRLWERPFFPRILPYNVACTDSVWTEFSDQYLKKKDDIKKDVFGKTRRLEHATTFFCNHNEYFAVTKAVDDVLDSLVNKVGDELQQAPMLLNVSALQSTSSLKDLNETGDMKKVGVDKVTSNPAVNSHALENEANVVESVLVEDNVVKTSDKGIDSEQKSNGTKSKEKASSVQKGGSKSCTLI